MRYFIDVNECCQDGLSILWDKWKAWEAHDNRALLALRQVEDKHLASCSKCNPEMLVDAFFQKAGKVTVRDENPLL